jgi:FtsH-binding integral membrane protein
MGLYGLILASIVNFFLGSAGLNFAIDVIGIIVFVGFTAYDSQWIKEIYYEGDGDVVAGKKAIFGALHLYLDFLNIFVFLMNLTGDRR